MKVSIMVSKHQQFTTLKYLNLSQSFLYRNIRNYEHCEKMCPAKNQPARLQRTTHDRTKEGIKFQTVIDKTIVYTLNAA